MALSESALQTTRLDVRSMNLFDDVKDCPGCTIKRHQRHVPTVFCEFVEVHLNHAVVALSHIPFKRFLRGYQIKKLAGFKDPESCVE